jgi:hypothetical protein
MKTKAFLMAMVCVVMLPAASFCEIKGDDLKKEVVMTEEAALLTQVDAVSLHLNSSKVIHAPRLIENKTIEVEMTILDDQIAATNSSLEKFVDRDVDTFVSVLKERLPIYAPTIAKTFDAKSDIVFVVNAGSRRVPVGRWAGGSFAFADTWTGGATAAISTPAVKGQATDEGKLGCNCPARHK